MKPGRWKTARVGEAGFKEAAAPVEVAGKAVLAAETARVVLVGAVVRVVLAAVIAGIVVSGLEKTILAAVVNAAGMDDTGTGKAIMMETTEIAGNGKGINQRPSSKFEEGFFNLRQQTQSFSSLHLEDNNNHF